MKNAIKWFKEHKKEVVIGTLVLGSEVFVYKIGLKNGSNAFLDKLRKDGLTFAVVSTPDDSRAGLLIKEMNDMTFFLNSKALKDIGSSMLELSEKVSN